LLIGGILLFLAALAGFLWWQQRQTEQAASVARR
jgi:predicted negative regulator of RcsB-dependent stress response